MASSAPRARATARAAVPRGATALASSGAATTPAGTGVATAVAEAAPRAGAPGAGAVVPAPHAVQRDASSSSDHLVKAVSALVVALVAARISGPMGIPLGTIATIGLAPVIVPAVRRFPLGTVLLVTVVVSIASGLWLAMWSATDHPHSVRLAQDWVFHLLGLGLGVAAVLWARTAWRDAQVALFFGVGLLVGVAGSVSASNPWKFSLALPVTVVVLAVAWLTRRWWLECAGLLALGGVSMVNDSRSLFGMFALAAALVAWQGWSRRPPRRGAAARYLVLVSVLGAGVYALGQSLLLEGALGEAAQERSARQIETSGSLLLGARPESGAALALIAHRPWGFGLGVRPTLSEILVAKQGMAELGYDPNNGYVERYMFGGAVEVHSVVGDLWALTGIAGLVLAVVVLVVLVRGLVAGLAMRTASALMILLCIRGLWDLFFGPLYSGLTMYTLAFGLALVRRPAATRTDDAAPARLTGGGLS